VTSPVGDRITAEELCTSNGNPFDGLQVIMVPGSTQTTTDFGAGCIRLLFQADDPPLVDGLDFPLPAGIRLVAGVRESVADCSFAQSLGRDPAEDVDLVEARGVGNFDGRNRLRTINLEGSLIFADSSTYALSARQLQVRDNNCNNDF
jgi:hypothetical protein